APGVEEDHRIRAQPVAGPANQLDVELLALAHRLPAEVNGGVPGLAPAPSDVARLLAVAAEQDRRVAANAVVLLPAEELVDRLPERLALQVPQRDVHRGHRGDADGLPAEVHRAAIHLLPEALVLEGVLAKEELPQSAGDVVAERGVDDRLDHLRIRVGLANPFETRVGADTDEDRVLAAGRFRLDVWNAKDLTDDFGDLHSGLAG